MSKNVVLLDRPKLACNWTDSVLGSAKSAGDFLKKQTVRSNEVSVKLGWTHCISYKTGEKSNKTLFNTKRDTVYFKLRHAGIPE